MPKELAAAGGFRQPGRGWEDADCQERRRDFGRMSAPTTFAPFANPNGIDSISPGLRGTSYPGWTKTRITTPTGLDQTNGAPGCNPFRIDDVGGRLSQDSPHRATLGRRTESLRDSAAHDLQRNQSGRRQDHRVPPEPLVKFLRRFEESVVPIAGQSHGSIVRGVGAFVSCTGPGRHKGFGPEFQPNHQFHRTVKSIYRVK
jgi:hypothetical protein